MNYCIVVQSSPYKVDIVCGMNSQFNAKGVGSFRLKRAFLMSSSLPIFNDLSFLPTTYRISVDISEKTCYNEGTFDVIFI